MGKTKSIALASFIGVGATLLVPTAAHAAPAVPQCINAVAVVKAPHGANTTLNVNRTEIIVGRGAIVTVNGNGNCILGSTGLGLDVNGNNNYVQAGRSNVTIQGVRDFFKSKGGNIVDCGGNGASLRATDAATNCN